MPDENAPFSTHNQGLLTGDDVQVDEFGEPVDIVAPAPTQPKIPPSKGRIDSGLKALMDDG